MNNITRNWQTTSFGILSILFSLFKIFTTGKVDPQDLVGISTGVGLIAAKDANKTGVDQTTMVKNQPKEGNNAS